MTPELPDRRKRGDRTTAFRSEGERRIGQFLNDYGIHYTYEQGVLVTDQDKPKIWHPDFYLPEFAAYIEYYGLAGNHDYNRGIQRKTAVYAANGLDVVPVYLWTFHDDWQGYIIESLHDISTRRLAALEQKRCSPARPTPRYSSLPRGPGGYSRCAARRYR